ncbi:GNAT family N-acetyltransferase [Micromonospora sp. WMMC250]|uniref:GNAT family N-acetyltransferase n=1 Tax=Micromonospora sp. WMMC250 TaxID=3014781 RepID=UPI0022B72B37|nr:GNAT family N-acetyltransferase [Micromonospora sp. WMMC250]MCZ7378995.1 GNAT family N-acetyltransferase [Micromonospora sp. WMMC250]
MTDLQFGRVQAVGSDATTLDWQHIHNLIIPTDPLSADEITVRAQRNILEVAYVDGVPVGCSTVRPPTSEPATVIARVLPEKRRQGFGAQIYQRGLAKARELGAQVVHTVVLASNDDGLRFARHQGFVEIDRYVLPGDTIAFVDLRLA